MFFDFCKNKSKFITLLLACVSLIVSLSLFGCDKNQNEKPTPAIGEKRYCSFSISNINSEFSLDKTDFKIDYGINVKNNLKNINAVFVLYDNEYKNLTALKRIENLYENDYSFEISGGNYIYKQSTVLHLENGFFDKTENTFFIGLCLYDNDDISFDNHPLAGYQCEIKYSIRDGKIAFEIKNESIIRNH